jgi:hypothetical protein
VCASVCMCVSMSVCACVCVCGTSIPMNTSEEVRRTLDFEQSKNRDLEREQCV